MSLHLWCNASVFLVRLMCLCPHKLNVMFSVSVCLLLTFYPRPWLHVQTSCHGWHRYCHAGPHWMGLRLHDHYNLGSVERDLVEGQGPGAWSPQGLGTAGFAQGQGLMVRVWTRRKGPGRCLRRGRMRGGGSRRRFTGGIPCVVWQDFVQVGFGLLQLRQRGVDFQRAWQLHIQLSCGERQRERRWRKEKDEKLYKQQLRLWTVSKQSLLKLGSISCAHPDLYLWSAKWKRNQGRK